MESTAAGCHALLVRVAGSTVSAVSDRAVVAGLTPWCDDVPGPADGVRAERRRNAELTRPATGVRCVLIRYADGVVDLVVVARRDLLDRAALGSLTAALATGGTEVRVPGEPAGPPVAVAPAGTAVPAWAVADRGTRAGFGHVHQDAVAVGDEESWRRAVVAVLERYGEPDPAVGTDRGPVTAAVGLLHGVARLDGTYLPCLAPPYPVTLSVVPGAGSATLRCDVRAGRADPSLVAAFVGEVARAHARRADAGEPRAAERAAEVAAAVASGRSPRGLVSAPRCVHDAVRRVAAATPDAVAVGDDRVRYTYAEADRRADRYAAALVDRGVRPGDRVGVCLDRSAETVVVLLGVLRAGAAYVPMDPAYPVERLSWTVTDADLAVVVTDHDGFAAPVRVRPADLLARVPDGSAGALRERLPAVDPDAPAYVIYTSGSTGRPKGVVVPHRNVAALVDATRDEYRLGAGDVWTFFHSGAFDFSVWEIWGCLLTGGRLVVVSYVVSRDPELFAGLLTRERVTVLSQTPSAFAQLLDGGGVEPAGLAVRLVVFGGEPLDARMLVRWFDRRPERVCRVVNMYGITETTVHVTEQTVTRELALQASRSVGRALPGWHLYVLDRAGRPVPPGVAGEIHVGGAGVASGYLGRDDLTAERFVPDLDGGGGVMYRSGDLGRLLPDGRLEHLGRIDDQVKIRGFRIELDEIRAVLSEVPGVVAAAVVVHRGAGDGGGDRAADRLDAYVVPAGAGVGAGVDVDAVRAHAARLLPEHMVPATVTALAALPLTTNGKLDRDRLPEPLPVTAASGSDPTGDDLTDRLREVWSHVLGVPVGPDDDFFDLGGNSLLAVRIGAATRASGLPAVALRQLYRSPTVRAVAELIRDDGRRPEPAAR